MKIMLATEQLLDTVKYITQETISTVYPHYYPVGAVAFFQSHHCNKNILQDITSNCVFLLQENDTFVGTVTIKQNEICRLFVIPKFQHNGYGRMLLDFAEEKIFQHFPEIILDASLPAKKIYQLRGYVEKEFHIIETANGDKLCYDSMCKKQA